MIQASNLVLTSDGKVVVGHNLLENDPTSSSEPLPENLEEFLMEMFWFFGVRVSLYYRWFSAHRLIYEPINLIVYLWPKRARSV